MLHGLFDRRKSALLLSVDKCPYTYASLQNGSDQIGRLLKPPSLRKSRCLYILETSLGKRRAHVFGITKLKEIRSMRQGNVKPPMGFYCAEHQAEAVILSGAFPNAQ